MTSLEVKVAERSKDITELFNALLTLEMQLVEQLEVRPSPWGTGVTRLCPASLPREDIADSVAKPYFILLVFS